MMEIAGITLSYASLFIGIVWLVGGLLCTLLTNRGGLYVAILLPLITSLLPILVRPTPGRVSMQLLPFGGDLAQYTNWGVIPFFSCIIGALLGELILPSEDEG